MSTITTLSTEAAASVADLRDKLNNGKVWKIDTIKAVYASHPAVTPEHLVIGVKGTQNIGFIYGAWAVHKGITDAGMLDINWLAANYASLVFDGTFNQQVKDIKEGQKAATSVARDQAINDGSYTVEGLATLETAFTKAAKLPMSSNKAVGEKLSALRLQLEALENKYANAVALSL